MIKEIHRHERQCMRTRVVIDVDLMKLALKTKKAAIEEGLKLLVQVRGCKEIKKYRGKLNWSGSLDEMRLD